MSTTANIVVGRIPSGKQELRAVTINTLLLDADGVLQCPKVRWRNALEPIIGSADPPQLERFLDDILEAEEVSLASPTGFSERLDLVLSKWSCSERATDVLSAMNAIEIHTDVMDAVQSFRLAGVKCHIASNQQALRARHMSEVMNYKSLFDSEFYSCFLGVAKPSIIFFEKILHALCCNGNAVLFIDDRAENVAAAKQAGLNAALYFGTEGASRFRCVLAEYGLSASHTAA